MLQVIVQSLKLKRPACRQAGSNLALRSFDYVYTECNRSAQDSGSSTSSLLSLNSACRFEPREKLKVNPEPLVLRNLSEGYITRSLKSQIDIH